MPTNSEQDKSNMQAAIEESLIVEDDQEREQSIEALQQQLNMACRVKANLKETHGAELELLGETLLELAEASRIYLQLIADVPAPIVVDPSRVELSDITRAHENGAMVRMRPSIWNGPNRNMPDDRYREGFEGPADLPGLRPIRGADPLPDHKTNICQYCEHDSEADCRAEDGTKPCEGDNGGEKK